MIVDLHVNAELEDGSLADPEGLLQAAQTAGLDAMVLTNGDNFDFDPAPYQAAGEAHGVKVFSGARLASKNGLLLCIVPEGQALSADFAEREGELWDAPSVIDAVEDKGGVTVALRPYDRDVAHPMGDHLFSLQGLTACEVISTGLPEIANDLALEAASNMEMPCVGTSSSQGDAKLGTTATLLRTPATNASELCELLRNGDCWPVCFSDEAPTPEPNERRGGRGGRRDGGGGRGRRDGGGGGGGRGRGGRGGGRGGERSGERGGERGGERSGGRRRGGRGGGGGGGGGGRRPDDFGNRAGRSSNRPVDENAGNRIGGNDERKVAEDIGNRLTPGQSSPYHDATRRDDDDSYGNS